MTSGEKLQKHLVLTALAVAFNAIGSQHRVRYSLGQVLQTGQNARYSHDSFPMVFRSANISYLHGIVTVYPSSKDGAEGLRPSLRRPPPTPLQQRQLSRRRGGLRTQAQSCHQRGSSRENINNIKEAAVAAATAVSAAAAEAVAGIAGQEQEVKYVGGIGSF